MSDDKKSKEYDRGYEDKRQERYDPPDGTGWIDLIDQSIIGQSDSDKEYNQGYDQAKEDGK